MNWRAIYPLPLYLASSLLSMFPVLRDPRQVLLWRGGAFSDLLISHWPNTAFVRRSLATWGQLPLWNPLILSGAPLAADPLAGLWYLPNWLAVLIPGAPGFHLLIWLHLAWAGIGAWRLARRLGAGHAAAIIAGLVFSTSPKLVGHVGLGHISLVYAVSWTPWVLLAAGRAARAVDAARPSRLAAAALAGALTGLVFLADPRWTPGLLLLGGAYYLWRAGGLSRWRPMAAQLAVGGPVALAVAAALALPLAEFVRLSTRAGLDLAASTASSLPLERLPSLLAPELGVWPEWQLYSGAIALMLACVAIAGKAGGARFWAVSALAALVVALGDGTPLYSVLRTLVPGVSQLRVPPRALLIADFGIAMLAAFGFEIIRSLPPRRLQLTAGAALAVYLIGATASWLGSSHALPQERVIQVVPWVISGVLVGMVGLLIATGLRIRLSPNGLVLLLVTLLTMDTLVVNLTTLKAEPVPVDPVVEWLASRVGPDQRIFSPSYSVRQPAAATRELHTADGVNPLQLASYCSFMDQAAGIQDRGYSVTLPPFPSGSIEQPWGFKPDLERLGWLSVSHIVSAYPVESGRLELLDQIDGKYIYRNPQVRSGAWVARGEIWSPVATMDWTPNSIRLTATGPGTLVLSEVSYPGWIARVDGDAVAIREFAGLFRSVELAEGEHTIEFTFRPATVYAGVALSLLGLLVTASLWVRK